jgi:hypothetical protein
MEKVINILKSLLKNDEKMCECGKYPKCVKKIYVSEEGRMWIETEEHFKCGKIQKQIEELSEIKIEK